MSLGFYYISSFHTLLTAAQWGRRSIRESLNNAYHHQWRRKQQRKAVTQIWFAVLESIPGRRRTTSGGYGQSRLRTAAYFQGTTRSRRLPSQPRSHPSSTQLTTSRSHWSTSANPNPPSSGFQYSSLLHFILQFYWEGIIVILKMVFFCCFWRICCFSGQVSLRGLFWLYWLGGSKGRELFSWSSFHLGYFSLLVSFMVIIYLVLLLNGNVLKFILHVHIALF